LFQRNGAKKQRHRDEYVALLDCPAVKKTFDFTKKTATWSRLNSVSTD